ncbi:MAG TPA: iron-sulfur cluster biosynthesis family protein [Cytophagales bacterium]|nr:iron-sulfur cluster biosynthesis family protein [Cytophagales bacterium]
MNLPVEISDKALEEIRCIIDQKKIPEGYCLRIGSRGNGCSGVSHYLGFDAPQLDDLSFEYGTVKILVKKKDFMHLIGVKLSFVEAPDRRGFVFE